MTESRTSKQRVPGPQDPRPAACICGDWTNPRCPVHGNHPSNIQPERDHGDCDNTRGGVGSSDDV